MRWPGLVPRALCKTPIQVTLRREGIDEDGAPVAALTVVWAHRENIARLRAGNERRIGKKDKEA